MMSARKEKLKVDIQIKTDPLRPSWTLADALLNDKHTSNFGEVQAKSTQKTRIERISTTILPPFALNLERNHLKPNVDRNLAVKGNHSLKENYSDCKFMMSIPQQLAHTSLHHQNQFKQKFRSSSQDAICCNGRKNNNYENDYSCNKYNNSFRTGEMNCNHLMRDVKNMKHSNPCNHLSIPPWNQPNTKSLTFTNTSQNVFKENNDGDIQNNIKGYKHCSFTDDSSSLSTFPLSSSSSLNYKTAFINNKNPGNNLSSTTINTTSDLDDLLDDLNSATLPNPNAYLGDKIARRSDMKIPKLRHSFEFMSLTNSSNYSNNNRNPNNNNNNINNDNNNNNMNNLHKFDNSIHNHNDNNLSINSSSDAINGNKNGIARSYNQINKHISCTNNNNLMHANTLNINNNKNRISSKTNINNLSKLNNINDIIGNNYNKLPTYNGLKSSSNLQRLPHKDGSNEFIKHPEYDLHKNQPNNNIEQLKCSPNNSKFVQQNRSQQKQQPPPQQLQKRHQQKHQSQQKQQQQHNLQQKQGDESLYDCLTNYQQQYQHKQQSSVSKSFINTNDDFSNIKLIDNNNNIGINFFDSKYINSINNNINNNDNNNDNNNANNDSLHSSFQQNLSVPTISNCDTSPEQQSQSFFQKQQLQQYQQLQQQQLQQYQQQPLRQLTSPTDGTYDSLDDLLDCEVNKLLIEEHQDRNDDGSVDGNVDGMYDSLQEFQNMKSFEEKQQHHNQQQQYSQQQQHQQQHQQHFQKQHHPQPHCKFQLEGDNENIYDNFHGCLDKNNSKPQTNENISTTLQQQLNVATSPSQHQQLLSTIITPRQQEQQSNKITPTPQQQKEQMIDTTASPLQQEQLNNMVTLQQCHNTTHQPLSIHQHPRTTILTNIQSDNFKNNSGPKENHISGNQYGGQIDIHTNSNNNNNVNNANDNKINNFSDNHVKDNKCATCDEKITGEVLMALNKLWHLDHFRCGHCQVRLGTEVFYEKDSVPYCERDFIELFSPKCFACNGPILEECVNALNQTWHPQHFSCHHCGVKFKVHERGDVDNWDGEDGEGYYEMDGRAYCSRDFFNLFALKCSGCRNSILAGYITALNQPWHNNCFVCTECKTPFSSGSFYDFDGLAYCEKHFNATRGGLCATCHQPITGASVMAMGKRYHPGHFVCTFCLQALNKGTFKEHNDRPYCHSCSNKLFC